MAGIAAKLLLRGQTNFVRSLWRFHSVYNAERQLSDHRRPVCYEISAPYHAEHVHIPQEELFVLSKGAPNAI